MLDTAFPSCRYVSFKTTPGGKKYVRLIYGVFETEFGVTIGAGLEDVPEKPCDPEDIPEARLKIADNAFVWGSV